MYQAYKFRIYPTAEQQTYFAGAFGCCHWLWNYSLNLCQQTYKETGKGLSQTAISQQGWREFRTLCEAKSEKFGREFKVINRWEVGPSQVCSDCGFNWGKIDLSTRSVLCFNGCSEQDRDKNIAQVGIGNCHDFKWTLRDCQTTSVAESSEASRITAALAGVSISIFHFFYSVPSP